MNQNADGFSQQIQMWVSFVAPLIHNFKSKPEQTLKINICHVNINSAFTSTAYVCLFGIHFVGGAPCNPR